MWIEIRHPKSGKLQFRYDPERQLAEVQHRGDRQVIDLKVYHEQVANSLRPGRPESTEDTSE